MGNLSLHVNFCNGNVVVVFVSELVVSWVTLDYSTLFMSKLKVQMHSVLDIHVHMIGQGQIVDSGVSKFGIQPCVSMLVLWNILVLKAESIAKRVWSNAAMLHLL